LNETYYDVSYYGGMKRSILNKVYGEPWSWVLGIISIAFAFLGVNMFRIGTYRNFYYDGLLLGLIVGMILHESAHKYAGRRNGCASMYVATAWGVLVTLASGFFPIKLLIPGFTSLMCFGRVSREGEFEISSWGPLTNIALAIVTVMLIYAGIHSIFLQGFLVINVWLAVFNLLPIPPLDGWKMMKIDPVKWGVMFAIGIILFFLPV
jgi:Zn-dependent protease